MSYSSIQFQSLSSLLCSFVLRNLFLCTLSRLSVCFNFSADLRRQLIQFVQEKAQKDEDPEAGRNNTEEIALTAMRQALEGRGLSVGDASNAADQRERDVQICALPRYSASEWYVLA